MRLDRGANGGLRQSALWGKPGRALASMVVVALALVATTAPGASTRYAYTTPGLIQSAKANPSQTFSVIIQGDADKSTGAIASVVKGELKIDRGAAKGIKRQFASVNGVAANLTGAQVLRIAQKNGIAAVTTDVPMQLAGSLSNKQRWPFVSGVQKFWSNGNPPPRRRRSRSSTRASTPRAPTSAAASSRQVELHALAGQLARRRPRPRHVRGRHRRGLRRPATPASRPTRISSRSTS